MGLLIAPVIFSLFSISSNIIIVKQQKMENPATIKLAQQQITNITIISILPEWIWMEGQIKLVVTSNITGTLNCNFGEPELKYFNLGNTNHDIVGNNMPQIIILRANPNLFTLPGIYDLSLLITLEGSLDQHSEDHEVILAMGHIFLYSILLVTGTAIIVILSVKPDLDEETLAKISSGSATGLGPSGGAHLPVGKIKCPGCGRIIEEGVNFCPECGDRIPEFLRFGPSSPS